MRLDYVPNGKGDLVNPPEKEFTHALRSAQVAIETHIRCQSVNCSDIL
jgi:hypothetical protein